MRQEQNMIQTVLFATDFSHRSDIALTRAAELAVRFSADLILLHVVDDDQPAPDVAAFSNLAEEHLETMIRGLPAELSARAQAIVARGDPFSTIVDFAQRQKVDVIVLGAHRRQTLRDIFTGTTAERVIRIGNMPVLMVSSPAAGPHEAALIGVDFSDGSLHAVAVARSLGMLNGLRIGLVHGFSDITKVQMQYVGLDAANVERQQSVNISKLSRDMTAEMSSERLGRQPDTVSVIEAEPCTAIAIQVEATSADLVIIGARGLNPVMRVLLGSVADAVLRNITSDVLVVPLERVEAS